MTMDVLFLLDISGSMEGDRLAKAKRALSLCLRELNEQDIFNVWAFHTTCNRLSPIPVRADAIWKSKSNAFLESHPASGGTDLDGTLIEALTDTSHKSSTVIFLSDGEPTVGETEFNGILQDIQIADSTSRPIIILALDDPPATPLLDNVARRTGGCCLSVNELECSARSGGWSLKNQIQQVLSGRDRTTREDDYLAVTGLGGCMEVGRSCFLIESSQFHILIDCGIRQPSGVPPINQFIDPHCIDAVIISHVHADHIGYLPLLVRMGFSGKVFGTGATRDFAEIMLKDKPAQEALGYEDKEVDIVFSLWHEIEATTIIRDRGLMLRFMPAGHILGAVSVELVYQGHRIVYTGDIGSESFFLTPYKLPRPGADLLLIESTYNDHDNEPIVTQAARLVLLIEEVLANDGVVVIPCFAVGRAQEILLALDEVVEEGRLPGIPIYIAGMIRQTNLVHNKWMPETQIANPIFINVKDTKYPFGQVDRRQVIYEPAIDEDGETYYRRRDDPRIIVTTSGMALGAAEYYLMKLGQEERNCVVLVGYQAEGTPGRALIKGTYTLKDEPFLMRVDKIGMSAHAGAGELRRYIAHCVPKKVLLVHGERDGLVDFVREIRRDSNEAEIMVAGKPYMVFGQIPISSRRYPFDWTPYNIPTLLPEPLEKPFIGSAQYSHTLPLKVWPSEPLQTWSSSLLYDCDTSFRSRISPSSHWLDRWMISPPHMPLFSSPLPIDGHVVAEPVATSSVSSHEYHTVDTSFMSIPVEYHEELDSEISNQTWRANGSFDGSVTALPRSVQGNHLPVSRLSLQSNDKTDIGVLLDKIAFQGWIRSPSDFATASLPNIDAFFPPRGAWLTMPPATAGQWFDSRGAPGFSGPTIHGHFGADPMYPWYSIKDSVTGETLAKGWGDRSAYITSILPPWMGI
jgi:metallo-beta-lactamase family protein